MEIFKRRALSGKRTVVYLTNIVGYRTVVLLIPSFKNFIYPLCVAGNQVGYVERGNKKFKFYLYIGIDILKKKNAGEMGQIDFNNLALLKAI